MLFPNAFPDLLTPNLGLAAALAAATTQTAVAFPTEAIQLRSAVSVAEVVNLTGSAPAFRYAGLRDNDMFFSGSLLKVAAMFAAFQLRQSATDHVLHAGDCGASAVFADLSASFDSNIRAAAPRIEAVSAVASLRVPKYSDIFAAPQALASGGCLMKFGSGFAGSLRKMIVQSDTDSSAACIKAIGFSFINAVHNKAGLLDDAAGRGVWLAGTFGGDAAKSVRVPSVNDGLSAQATTSRAMTQLFALILEGTKLDARSVDGIAGEMRNLLGDAQTTAGSWMSGGRPGFTSIGPEFSITHSKIGEGSLGAAPAGPAVFSEATILTHATTGRQFIVVWQNVGPGINHVNAMTFLVRHTLLNFVAIP